MSRGTGCLRVGDDSLKWGHLIHKQGVTRPNEPKPGRWQPYAAKYIKALCNTRTRLSDASAPFIVPWIW